MLIGVTCIMGTLYIVATPIGNREDITIRALKTLMTVPVIACEDTRHTGQLLKSYQNSVIKRHPELVSGSLFKNNKMLNQAKVLSDSERIQHDSMKTKVNERPRLISFYDEVEEQKIPEIIGYLHAGKDVALVSDAGTPLISDPGFKLVRECRKRGIAVSPIPGPSSVIAALSVAGLPTDSFAFLGYLSRKPGRRAETLQYIKILKRDEIVKTVVFFESPHRIKQTLTDLFDVFGDIPVVLCEEMTKLHETFIADHLQRMVSSPLLPKGEFTIVL